MDGPLALAEKTPKIEKARPTEEGRAISKRMEGGRCEHHWNPMARGACWFWLQTSLVKALAYVIVCQSMTELVRVGSSRFEQVRVPSPASR